MSTSCYIIEGAQSDKWKATPNKRWSKGMDNVLIHLLADMARSDLKVDQSFKHQMYVKAVNIENSKFPAACMDVDNVDDHMRTMKQKCLDIKKLMNRSALDGMTWGKFQCLNI